MLQECKENYPFPIQLFLHKHDAERSLPRHRWGKGTKYFPCSLYILKNLVKEGRKRIFCTAFAFYYALLTIYLLQPFKLFTQLTKYWDGTFSNEFYKQGATTLLAISGCSSSDLTHPFPDLLRNLPSRCCTIQLLLFNEPRTRIQVLNFRKLIGNIME